jgi:hypothetical protein
MNEIRWTKGTVLPIPSFGKRKFSSFMFSYKIRASTSSCGSNNISNTVSQEFYSVYFGFYSDGNTLCAYVELGVSFLLLGRHKLPECPDYDGGAFFYLLQKSAIEHKSQAYKGLS